MIRKVLVACLLIVSNVVAEYGFCPDDQTMKTLLKHTYKSELSKLLVNKEFIDVWRRSDYVKSMSCSMTKITPSPDNNGHLKVLMHNLDKDNNYYKFSADWVEQPGSGVFYVEGIAHDGTEYEGAVYILHADESVFAYYACSPTPYNKAISVVHSRKDDPAVKESIEAAKAKLKELESIIGSMEELSQSNCPSEYPDEPFVIIKPKDEDGQKNGDASLNHVTAPSNIKP